MLTALSPLDGRYSSKVDALRDFFSEYALQRYRVLVEVRYLIALSEERGVTELPPFSAAAKKALLEIPERFGKKESERIKEIEQVTNHDVKAVEYYLREELTRLKLGKYASFLHFAVTSEDINNLAYALMLKGAMEQAYVPKLVEVEKTLKAFAKQWRKIPMLARTHGQSATPTTVGKEMLVFAVRMGRAIGNLKAVPYLGKLNGATGTFAAHRVAYPKVDWVKFSEKFIKGLGLTPNLVTTQIEPHDFVAELCDAAARADTILTDVARDMWLYISQDYFKLKKKEGEVGSSTMPHKVNPIDFENAEGNFGIANVLFRHFAEKLPMSRLQRDLTDSTVLRALGVAFGHAYLAQVSLLQGLGKLELNKDRVLADLQAHPEVLAEAVQTVLRRYGVESAYEQLKGLTRGAPVTLLLLHEFIRTLEIPEEDRKRLLAMGPEEYVGVAGEL